MSKSAAKSIARPLPRALTGKPNYQSGIIDPMWPSDYDAAVQMSVKRREEQHLPADTASADPAKEKDIRARYASEYAGRVSRQDFMTLLRADVLAADREELKQVLQLLTKEMVTEMERSPSTSHVAMLEEIPDSYRVTLTLGLGETLFVDRNGEDRFGLCAKRPRFLKTMPSFPGDAATFNPETTGSDLILLIATDHPYVNTAIARFFGEFFNRRFSDKHHGRNPRPMLRFRPIEQGFARKDKREFLGFDDGIQNLQMDQQDLERLVFVSETEFDTDWCVNGSYLVYRKIREDMPRWESTDKREQEATIGREKSTGLPLSHKRDGVGNLTPVFVDPKVEDGVRLNAHIRKVQPRRPGTDLFGLHDLERRFLRRPYPFFDGLDANGCSTNGLQFIAFMKSIQQQFEHVTNMWQMNPNFPVPGTGIDALYAKEILSTIDGGYYFCPPGLTSKSDFFASGLFE